MNTVRQNEDGMWYVIHGGKIVQDMSFDSELIAWVYLDALIDYPEIKQRKHSTYRQLGA